MGKPDAVRVLLADNDEDYRRSLVFLLRVEGYAVVEAASADEATRKLEAEPVALALVDLCLTTDGDAHDLSGMEVARRARDRGIPCVMVTAYDTVDIARAALRSRGGEPLALDLVPKRLGPQALLDAVAAALLEQAPAPGAPSITPPVPALALDPAMRQVRVEGRPVSLSRQQYVLLEYLYRHRGNVCSYVELYQIVYEERLTEAEASADKRLERLVARLREKIEQAPREPRYLITIPWHGLQLKPEP